MEAYYVHRVKWMTYLVEKSKYLQNKVCHFQG